MDHTQTPLSLLDAEFEQRLMAGWEHVHEGNQINNAGTPQVVVGLLQAAIAPLPTAPLCTIPAHREWEGLANLDAPALMAILSDLTARCATDRDVLHNTLTNLETITQIFVSKHAPMSINQHADYSRAFNTAVKAGRDLFPPQESYRNTLTTLGMLVTDLIDVLPKQSAVKKRMRAEFDEGMARANEKEQNVRSAMRGLVDATRKGEESFSLALYMNISRQRFGNWGAEENRFKCGRRIVCLRWPERM